MRKFSVSLCLSLTLVLTSISTPVFALQESGDLRGKPFKAGNDYSASPNLTNLLSPTDGDRFTYNTVNKNGLVNDYFWYEFNTPITVSSIFLDRTKNANFSLMLYDSSATVLRTLTQADLEDAQTTVLATPVDGVKRLAIQGADSGAVSIYEVDLNIGIVDYGVLDGVAFDRGGVYSPVTTLTDRDYTTVSGFIVSSNTHIYTYTLAEDKVITGYALKDGIDLTLILKNSIGQTVRTVNSLDNTGIRIGIPRTEGVRRVELHYTGSTSTSATEFNLFEEKVAPSPEPETDPETDPTPPSAETVRLNKGKNVLSSGTIVNYSRPAGLVPVESILPYNYSSLASSTTK